MHCSAPLEASQWHGSDYEHSHKHCMIQHTHTHTYTHTQRRRTKTSLTRSNKESQQQQARNYGIRAWDWMLLCILTQGSLFLQPLGTTSVKAQAYHKHDWQCVAKSVCVHTLAPCPDEKRIIWAYEFFCGVCLFFLNVFVCVDVWSLDFVPGAHPRYLFTCVWRCLHICTHAYTHLHTYIQACIVAQIFSHIRACPYAYTHIQYTGCAHSFPRISRSARVCSWLLLPPSTLSSGSGSTSPITQVSTFPIGMD